MDDKRFSGLWEVEIRQNVTIGSTAEQREMRETPKGKNRSLSFSSRA